MSSANHFFLKLSTAALASAMLFAFCTPAKAQTPTVGNVKITGVPDDWTHHHLVFSDPGTEQDAIDSGKYQQWLKIVNDPRYVIQQLKRHAAARGPAADDVSRIEQAAQARAALGPQFLTGDFTPDLSLSAAAKAKKTKITKDWSVSLGSGTPATASGTFTGNPTASQTVTVDGTKLTANVSAQATGSITISSTAFCVEPGQGITVDGVSLTTNATVGSGALTVDTNPGNNTNEAIGGVTYNLRTGSPGSTADRVLIGSTAAGTAENLTAAINATGSCSSSPCFGSSTVANPLVTASWAGGTSAVVSLSGKCGGVVTLDPDDTDIKVSTAWPTTANGTTSGTHFALNSTSSQPTDDTVATQIGAAISANSSTGVTETVSGDEVSLTAVTGGTAGNTALTTTIGTGATLSGMTGGTNGANTGTNFAVDFNTTDNATNLAAAINSLSGVNATSNGATVTVTAATGGTAGNSIGLTPEDLSNFAWNGSATTLSGGASATVQPNAYPAKYGLGPNLTTASCSDYAIYPTGQPGESGAANIIAYTNLYSGCSGTVPAVNWAYNTATGYSVTTSPVLSLDGTQVAFIESNGTTASLVLVNWAAETGETVTSPLTLANQASASAYNSCNPSALNPCMYTIAFGNGKNDTLSAPFYDYADDTLYVGDDSGNLHQFTGVFLGSPTETTSAPWPVALGSNKLASPVFDDNWDAVFVGDLGGKLYCVTPTKVGSGSCQTGKTQLGSSSWYESSTTTVSEGQIADAPLINSSANYLLAFVDTSASPGANTVYGHSEQYFPSSSPGSVGVGTGGSNYYLYAGAFDNAYYDSPNNTGEMYVVGNTGVTTGATLYRVTLSDGFLSGATAVVSDLTESGAYPWPSPVTEFCNNGASQCALPTVSGCTVSTTSTTLTCTSGGFTSADVGATIVGTDMTADPATTITGYTSGNTVTISAFGTGDTSSGTATIGVTNAGTDYVLFSVNQGKVGSCTTTAGHGCVLSYDVSNPSTVAISGSGLPVTTPGTNGCWATGGIIIDNSATTATEAGASQIYLINLNGATAGGANGATPTSGSCSSGSALTIDATQAQQSNPSE